MGKHERQASPWWVVIDGILLPLAEWRYLVTDHDPARFDASHLHINNPFSYQALRADLIRRGVTPGVIPSEKYFIPSADEKDERAGHNLSRSAGAEQMAEVKTRVNDGP